MTAEGHRFFQRLYSLTDDELSVLRLEMLLVLREIDEEFEQESREQEIDDLQREILETARAQQKYHRHVDWCRSLWCQRSGNDIYVPALTGRGMGEYRDWEKPKVMERREALRSIPTVSRLLTHLKQQADNRSCA